MVTTFGCALTTTITGPTAGTGLGIIAEIKNVRLPRI